MLKKRKSFVDYKNSHIFAAKLNKKNTIYRIKGFAG